MASDQKPSKVIQTIESRREYKLDFVRQIRLHYMQTIGSKNDKND